MNPLFIVCFLALYNQVFSEIKISRFNATKRLEIVFVHGSSGRMSHLHAYQFCKNLTNYLNVNNTEDDPYVSDLLSIHDHFLISENFMPWLLKMNKEIFWIGGTVKIIPHGHHRRVPISRWTDRSPFTVKNYFPHVRLFHHVHIGDRFCVMIAYTSGRWSVDDCGSKMFFACQIIRQKMPIDKPKHEEPLERPKENRKSK